MKASLISTLVLALAVSPASAQETIEDSPFIPKGFYDRGSNQGAQPTLEPPPQFASLELRGMYTLGKITYVNIFNVAEQKGTWIQVGDPNARIPVNAVNMENPAAQVIVGGNVQTLALKKPSETPMAVSSAPRAVAPNQGKPGQPNAQPVISSPGTRTVTTNDRATRPVIRRRAVVPNRGSGSAVGRNPGNNGGSRSNSQNSSDPGASIDANRSTRSPLNRSSGVTESRAQRREREAQQTNNANSDDGRALLNSLLPAEARN